MFTCGGLQRPLLVNRTLFNKETLHEHTMRHILKATFFHLLATAETDVASMRLYTGCEEATELQLDYTIVYTHTAH